MKFTYIILIYITLTSAELEIRDIIKFKNVSVDLNELVDSYIPQIAQFIINRGLDPLKLPETEQRLWTQLPNQVDTESMIYKADLVLHTGILNHLSNLERYGDTTLTYINRTLNIDIGFEFKLLQGMYDYILKMVILRFEGHVIASTERVRAKISVTFNATNYTIVLNKLELQTPGRIKIVLENKNGQRDWLNTAIVNIVAPFFQNTITNVVQKEATNAVQTYFDEINRTITGRIALAAFFEYQLFNRITRMNEQTN